MPCGALKSGLRLACKNSMIPQDLLDILACPECKKPLLQAPDGSSLKCTGCRRVYPVRDGIPILLKDEAGVEES